MRVFVFALAISLPLAPAAAIPSPGRVASLNLCADELLLAVADPRQILSLTYLSSDPREVPWWRQARPHHRNDGSMLAVVPLRPDLVVMMGGGGRDSARIAARLGIKVLSLPYPQSISDVEQSLRTLSNALGRRSAGDAVAGQMEALRRSAPLRSRDAAWLGGGGRSFAAVGLGAEWMKAAGLRQRSLPGDRLTLEQIAVDPPQYLLRGDYRTGQYSAEQKWLDHPLVRKQRLHTIATDGRAWTCMGPSLVPEIVRLRRTVAQ